MAELNLAWWKKKKASNFKADAFEKALKLHDNTSSEFAATISQGDAAEVKKAGKNMAKSLAALQKEIEQARKSCEDKKTQEILDDYKKKVTQATKAYKSSLDDAKKRLKKQEAEEESDGGDDEKFYKKNEKKYVDLAMKSMDDIVKGLDQLTKLKRPFSGFRSQMGRSERQVVFRSFEKLKGIVNKTKLGD